eukprot:COSAG05_NODE_28024_length_136_cov_53.243243_1_plen_21_part_01
MYILTFLGSIDVETAVRCFSL